MKENGGWGRNRTGVHGFAVSQKNKARRPSMINQDVRHFAGTYYVSLGMLDRLRVVAKW